jgi:predicted O-methyltransferase YrrM
MHRGSWEFGNDCAWGEPFDREYVNASVIPDDGFKFPWDVEGWLTFTEGRKLFELAKGKRVLEIGSYCGRSTVCLAQSAESVDSVDPHDGRGTAVQVNTYDRFLENMQRYGVDAKVTAHVSTARDYCRRPEILGHADQFDLIFIDGAHDYASVQSDIEDAMLVLADDGLLAFHDYRSAIDPDVTRSVNEFISAGAELVSTHDNLAVVRPPAAIPLEV